MKKKIKALMVAAALSATPALADENGVTRTALELANHCAVMERAVEGNLTANEAYSIGYCLGSVGMFTFFARVHEIHNLCLPDSLDSGQVAKLFVTEVKKHPEVQNMTYQTVMHMALYKHYGCNTKASR